jgi:hypothetical protein
MIEGGAIAAATFAATIALGLHWWFPLALFLAWDLSALGYLAGPRVGAFFYNLVHNYAGPVLLGLLALLMLSPVLAAIALSWGFHVGADRALGYGLKHDDAFQHTHLGWIGKRNGESAPH